MNQQTLTHCKRLILFVQMEEIVFFLVVIIATIALVVRKTMIDFLNAHMAIFQINMSQELKHEVRDRLPSQDLQFTPFRTLNDFLLDATWNVPNFSDLARLNNRIVSNLIYYQTNYFIFGIILFLLVGYKKFLLMRD